MARADLVEAGEPVHVRHADVEEDELGVRLPDERQHLGARLRLADDLESAVGFERPLDPVEDEAMVVGDHNAHGDQCRTGLRCRSATPSTARLRGPPNRSGSDFADAFETLDPGIYRAPNGGYLQTQFTELGTRMRLKLEGKHTGS